MDNIEAARMNEIILFNRTAINRRDRLISELEAHLENMERRERAGERVASLELKVKLMERELQHNQGDLAERSAYMLAYRVESLEERMEALEIR